MFTCKLFIHYNTIVTSLDARYMPQLNHYILYTYYIVTTSCQTQTTATSLYTIHILYRHYMLDTNYSYITIYYTHTISSLHHVRHKLQLRHYLLDTYCDTGTEIETNKCLHANSRNTPLLLAFFRGRSREGNTPPCVISSFRRGVNGVFALLRCYAALIHSYWRFGTV